MRVANGRDQRARLLCSLQQGGIMELIINGQLTEVTEQDYKEIINLLLFKERLKKSLDNGYKLCYNKGTKKEER